MLQPVKLTGQTTVAFCVGQALPDEIRGMPCRHSIQGFVRRRQTYWLTSKKVQKATALTDKTRIILWSIHCRMCNSVLIRGHESFGLCHAANLCAFASNELSLSTKHAV
ncbi:MAG: hypothetical protein ACI92S_000560 [Planctomycetaceae bacterium]|jgi:hypothetical protein